jgi:hypothetical protein
MLFSSFCCSHCVFNPASAPLPGPPDPPDTVPDLCYERDFDVPDTRSLLDEFLSKMSKSVDDEYRTLSDLLATIPDPSGYARASALTVSDARENGLMPKPDTAILEAFSASEIKMYKHTTKYKWTIDELVDTIKLIKSADFKVDDINVDLHKRIAAAVAKGHFTSHNMRESELDGDQDLLFWLRSLEDVLREVLGVDRMEGHQHIQFEISVDEDGRREFGASNGAVSFQIAQIHCGEGCTPVSLVIYIDGSFIKYGIQVKPIYGMYKFDIYRVYT